MYVYVYVYMYVYIYIYICIWEILRFCIQAQARNRIREFRDVVFEDAGFETHSLLILEN